MIIPPRHLALFAVIAAGLLPAAGAQAQNNGATAPPAPLYPYAVRGHQTYAAEVAPKTYRIRGPVPARTHQYIGRRGGHAVLNHPPKKADRALIEKMHKHLPIKHIVIHARKIGHDAPVGVETRRAIERRHFVADRDIKKRAGRADSKKRIFHAEAEITIHGPDRMSIRLFRKQYGSKANVHTE